MRRIRPHLTFANVASAIALFVAISGGTALALNGSNTVQSDDIGPGAQVKAADIAANAVAAPPWRRIGTAGQPAFHQTSNCFWHNYDQVHSVAAFTRDAAGFVHLKGTVVAEDDGFPPACRSGSQTTNEVIFILPPGYRPQKRAAMTVPHVITTWSSDDDDVTLVIDGPSISPLPAGAVSIDRAELDPGQSYFILDGTSFRCEPSGSNGCP
jgi:hypothetical protein